MIRGKQFPISKWLFRHSLCFQNQTREYLAGSTRVFGSGHRPLSAPLLGHSLGGVYHDGGRVGNKDFVRTLMFPRCPPYSGPQRGFLDNPEANDP